MADGGDNQQEAQRTEPKSMEEESKGLLDLNLDPRGTSDDRTEHRNETEPEKRDGGRTTTGSAQIRDQKQSGLEIQRDVEMQTRSARTESRALPLKKRRQAMDLVLTQSETSNGRHETKPEKRVQDFSEGKGGLRINEDNPQPQRLREFESQAERDSRLLRQVKRQDFDSQRRASKLERQRRSHDTQYDCYNYVNNGQCILGNSCSFNHPHLENRDWSYDERRGYETESRSIRGRNIPDSRDQDRDLWRGFEENQREQTHQTIEWQRRGDQENEQEQRLRESTIPDSRDRDSRERSQEISQRRDEEDCIYELEKKFNMDISQIKDTIAAGIKRAMKENRSIIPRGYPVEQRHGNIGAPSTEDAESVEEGEILDSDPGESSDQSDETEPKNRENGVSGLRSNGNGHILHHDSRERRHEEEESRSMQEMRPVWSPRDRDPRRAFFERQGREAQEMQLDSSSGIQNVPVPVTNPRVDMSGDGAEGNQNVQPSAMVPDNKDEQVSEGSLDRGAPETVGRAFRASRQAQHEAALASQRPHFGRHQNYVPPQVEEDDASMIATQEDCDRMYAEELSKQYQEEDLASQQPRLVQPLAYVPAAVDNIDPTFLEALPEDLRAEVLASQQPRFVQPLTYVLPEVNHIDPEYLALEAFPQDEEEYEIDIEALEALPQNLREKAYLDCSQAELEALPRHLRTEAQICRDQEMHRQLGLQEQIQGDIERMEKLRLKASTVLDPQELERLGDIIRRLSDEILEQYKQARMANILMDSRKLKTSGDIVLDILKRFKQERMAVNRSVNAQENPVEQGQVDTEMQRREAEDQELEELIAQYERDIKEQ